MHCRHRLAAALLVSFILLGAGSGVFAQSSGSPAIEQTDAGITLNLRDTEIQTLISAVADLTGRNFVVDPRVKGRVTVISSAPTNKEELYDVFLSILKVHGFAALDTGDVIKIVPDATARQEPSRDRDAARGGERQTTTVIPIVHTVAAELVPILRPLLPQEAHLAAVQSSNHLVIADVASNINRIIGIVRKLDRPSEREIEFVALEHADAEDVVQTIQSIETTGATNKQSAAASAPLVADPRTNRIALSGLQNERVFYRRLIKELDRPTQTNDGAIDVIFLQFANAADLVDILQSVGDRVVQQEQANSGGQAQARPRANNNQFMVHADESTNALIIQAEPEVMQVVRAVISKLDVRRAQVLVEGIVAEVSSTQTNELGIQWKSSTADNGVFAGSLLPGVSSGGITSPFSEDAAPSFLNGLTLGYFSQGDLRGLIRALGGDQFTNVLSTPTLVTLDNAEAEIVVGQNVPFITGQFTNQATSPDNPFQTIERQDVGIVLRVKPQINDGDSVTLEIEQEVSSVDRDTSGSDLITNKRSITTTVLVDDRDIIVLGGLISDDVQENTQKIPLFGDIPILGQLFRNNQSEFVKTNLMVFLKPSIIRDEATGRDLVRKRYEDMRQRQVEQEKEQHFFLRKKGPELPAFDGLLE